MKKIDKTGPDVLEDEKFWEDAEDRYRRRKLKELIANWQKKQRENGLPWSHQALASEMGFKHRNTINGWINGKAWIPWTDICKFFRVEPSFFLPAPEEIDITDKNHHLLMKEEAAACAEKHHVSKTFLWFLKSDPEIQHEILDNQHTDAYLNSFDLDVPDIGSPFQFSLKSGEHAYLNDSSLQIIGNIEKEVRDYTTYKIRKEFSQKNKDPDKHQSGSNH